MKDRGELLENYVFSQLYLRHSSQSKINFWCAKQKPEYDFILKNENSAIVNEDKWNLGDKTHLKAFLMLYLDSLTLVIGMNHEFFLAMTVNVQGILFEDDDKKNFMAREDLLHQC